MSDDPKTPAISFSLDRVPTPIGVLADLAAKRFDPAPPPVERPFPTLLIVGSWAHRDRVIQEMKRSKNGPPYKVVTVGQELAGYRCGDILITREAMSACIDRPNMMRWLEQDVPLRQRPGYSTVYL
jgi:hypothetical protein